MNTAIDKHGASPLQPPPAPKKATTTVTKDNLAGAKTRTGPPEVPEIGLGAIFLKSYEPQK